MTLDNPDTLILNLTFLGTVGIAFLMFLVLFLLGVITLVLAGIGRLAAVALMALFGWHAREETLPLNHLGGVPGRTSGGAPSPDSGAAPATVSSAGVSSTADTTVGSTPDTKARKPPREWRALKTARREPPRPAPDWARAVAEADARALAKARVEAPPIQPTGYGAPPARGTGGSVTKVAPLVEAAVDRGYPGQAAPGSSAKPGLPAPIAALDTGSLASRTRLVFQLQPASPPQPASLSGPKQPVKDAVNGNSGVAGTGKTAHTSERNS